MASVRCEVQAVDLDEAGHGVGPEVGVPEPRLIHVADLLPGERAEVQLDHTSPHKPEGWGHAMRRLGAPSPDRVAPTCPGFGRCGGCIWQHLAYPAQLAAKHRRVKDALAALPGIADGTVAIADVRPSPTTIGYRNKGKYVVGRVADLIT